MKNEFITRRNFIQKTTKYCALFAGGTLFLPDSFLKDLILYQKQTGKSQTHLFDNISEGVRAKYWISNFSTGNNCTACHSDPDVKKNKDYIHKEKVIKCLLCAQGCSIEEGETGKCRARKNINGELRSLVYGHPISMHIDPIEKKPFYHFLPKSTAFSLATAGCPLSCQFCQNWEISQSKPEDFNFDYVPPEKIVTDSQLNNVPIIAFTYNEPTVFIEYLVDISTKAKKENLRSVLISCGFMNEAPLAEMCSVLDAIKIDLKGFSADFYHKICNAELKPVLRSIKQVSKTKTHLEIVNLVVPTLNDSDKMLSDLSDWIVGELGPNVPVHFTRFHPDYKLLNLPPTPIATLERARDKAMDKGIHYVYIGNVPGHSGNNTYCPSCGQIVIKRSGFFVQDINIKNGKCKYCSTEIAGVWN